MIRSYSGVNWPLGIDIDGARMTASRNEIVIDIDHTQVTMMLPNHE